MGADTKKIDLPALKAKNLPHCKWEDFLTAKGEGLAPEEKKALDEYLYAFLPPAKESACINCEVKQGGWAAAITGQGFTYGLAHGEGFCGTCGYPARANHYDFGPIESVMYVLQYHPDGLGAKSEIR